MPLSRLLSPNRQQWPMVALVFAILALNLATIQTFPIVWQDEVMFTEPAANWIRHGALFSRAWFFDRESEIWAGNSPIYTILLTPWLKIFGVNPTSARSFGMLLGVLGVVASVVAARRAGLLKSGAMTFLYLAALFMAYGVGVNLRSGRYDGLGILVLGLIALVLTAPPSLRRSMAIFLLSAIIPASGMYLIVTLVAGSAAAIIIYGRKFIGIICVASFGIVVGFVIMFFIFSELGVLNKFIHSSRALSQFGGGGIPKDPSLYLIVLAASLNYSYRSYAGEVEKSSKFLLIFPLFTGLILIYLEKFPNYYSWMVLFPLALLALTGIDKNDFRYYRVLNGGIFLLLFAAMALGLPLQLSASIGGPSRDYDRVSRFVARHVHSADIAYVSPAAWYAAWPIAAKTYTTEYDSEHRFMTQADERRVSVLVIDPMILPAVEGRFGRDWQQVAILDDPQRSMPLFSSKFGAKLTWHYRLAVYRRD